MKDETILLSFSGVLTLEDLKKAHRHHAKRYALIMIPLVSLFLFFLYYLLYNALENMDLPLIENPKRYAAGAIFIGIILGTMVGLRLRKKKRKKDFR